MPLLICFGLDNYAHAQTVDTRPFFLGGVGPGNEARMENNHNAEIFEISGEGHYSKIDVLP